MSPRRQYYFDTLGMVVDTWVEVFIRGKSSQVGHVVDHTTCEGSKLDFI